MSLGERRNLRQRSGGTCSWEEGGQIKEVRKRKEGEREEGEGEGEGEGGKEKEGAEEKRK